MSVVDTMQSAVHRQRHRGIGVFRIAVGVLFAIHGASTVLGLFGGTPANPGHAADFGAWPSWWAGLIQLVGGILIALGVGTRSAAFVSSGAMAYAYFAVHQPQGLTPVENGGTAAAALAWALLALVFTGPGAWALESVLPRTRGSVSR